MSTAAGICAGAAERGPGGQASPAEALTFAALGLRGGGAVGRFPGTSSFSFASGGGSASSGPGLWGAGSYRRLSEDAGSLFWDGDLSGVRLGMEMQPRPQLRLGLSTGHWQGAFDWTETLPATRAEGRYDVGMTAVHPYARWASADGRMRLWGSAGYGSGEVETEEYGSGAGVDKSDIGIASAAWGAGRDLRRSAAVIPGGETVLRAKGQASMTWIDVDGNAGIGSGLSVAPALDMQRLLLVLEARHDRELETGARLEASLETGLRSDFGDGEGDAALETGLKLRYLDPAAGFTADGGGHVVAADSGGLDEWGVTLQLRHAPEAGGRSLSVDLSSGYGAETGASLLRESDTAYPAAGKFEPEARLDAAFGYGMSIWRGAGLFTPYGGLSLSGSDEQRYRVGGRWTWREGLGLRVEGERRLARAAENRAALTGQVRF